MEQTILQLPMQSSGESPSVQDGIGVIYSKPPVLAPVAGAPVVLPPQPLDTTAMADVAIGRRRLEILKALIECQDLTIDQLQRWLRLSPASRPYLREHLRVLTKGQFVEALAPAKQSLYGRAPNVYSYGTEARKYLRALGYPVPTRYRPLKERLHKEYPIRHTLAVNEVLLQARNLTWETQDARLADYRHEKILLISAQTSKPRSLAV